MDPGNVSAIISALSAIGDVVLGNFLVAAKERRAKRTEEGQDTTPLGVIVVSHLDTYAAGCLHFAFDDGTQYGRPGNAANMRQL